MHEDTHMCAFSRQKVVHTCIHSSIHPSQHSLQQQQLSGFRTDLISWHGGEHLHQKIHQQFALHVRSSHAHTHSQTCIYIYMHVYTHTLTHMHLHALEVHVCMYQYVRDANTCGEGGRGGMGLRNTERTLRALWHVTAHPKRLHTLRNALSVLAVYSTGLGVWKSHVCCCCCCCCLMMVVLLFVHEDVVVVIVVVSGCCCCCPIPLLLPSLPPGVLLPHLLVVVIPLVHNTTWGRHTHTHTHM